MKAVASMVVLVLIAGACSGSDEPPATTAEDVTGYWWLESWVEDSEREFTLGYGTVFSQSQPWVFFGDYLEGSGGCNRFTQGGMVYRVEHGRLYPGEVGFDAALCGETLDAREMIAEVAMQRFLWGRAEAGFEVRVVEDSMSWRMEGLFMKFDRAHGPPVE